MSAQQFSNGLGNVRLVDREHINPMLQGILYSTDRKAQVAVLENESRRNSSATSTPATSRKNSFMSPFSSRKNSTSSRKNSVVSPDVVSEHSYSSEKRRKSSLFGMAAFGKGMGPGNNNAHLL